MTNSEEVRIPQKLVQQKNEIQSNCRGLSSPVVPKAFIATPIVAPVRNRQLTCGGLVSCSSIAASSRIFTINGHDETMLRGRLRRFQQPRANSQHVQTMYTRTPSRAHHTNSGIDLETPRKGDQVRVKSTASKHFRRSSSESVHPYIFCSSGTKHILDEQCKPSLA